MEHQQSRPESTNAARYMSKVPDEDAMQERVSALKPDAFATGIGVGEHCRVVHA